MRENIEDGNSRLPAPEPLGEGGPDLHYFLLGEAIHSETLQQKSNHKGRKNSQVQDLQRHEGG